MKRLTPLQEKINQRPCPICGGTEYEWGYLNHAWYQKNKVGFSHKVIMVRRCLRCENLQHFVDEALTKSGNRWVLVAILLNILILIIMGMAITHTGPFYIPPRF